MANDVRSIGRALLSVSDKTGLISLARMLVARGVELVSTGGTGRALAVAKIAVRDASELTGFPEMMDGRVKTLHPKIHGGLLAVREDPEHEAALLAHNIAPIDLLVVNLYPFEQMLARGAPFNEMIETIDVGGPAMIRGAAKNHADVVVIVDPADYDGLGKELERHAGGTSLNFRRMLAQKAYARTSSYDAAISNWLAGVSGQTAPAWRSFGGALASSMRYGENPHQFAAFYRTPDQRAGVATARQLQGKELSYNNLTDADAAYELAAEFDPRRTAVVVIVKHANPCGVAEAANLGDAYQRALSCDPVSAFGGVIAVNRKLDADAARKMIEIFTEVILAPDADEEAIALLAGRKNLRLLLAGSLPDPRAGGLVTRTLAGGFLTQSRDNAVVDDMALQTVTKRAPTPHEIADLKFAFRVAKHVKSNAIVYARDGATVGIGAGQMSRVDSSQIAARKALDAAQAAGLAQARTRGAVVASDAFFPFADGLMAAAQAGVTAVIQPGGSIRDDEVIAAADKAGLAMVFTGVRHFRH